MPAAYPVVEGRIQAPRCEVNVVEHCNLACRSCSHLSPVLPKSIVDAALLYRDLALLARHYHAGTVRLLGGEPLLHPDLLSVIEAVRRSGVTDSVCVVTNGLLLPRMADEFWQAVDVVQVSLYPGRELEDDDRRACLQRAAAGGTMISFSTCDTFRQSYSEQGTDDSDLIRAIYDSCLVVHQWRCHTVAEGRFYKCPQAYFLPKLVDACAGTQLQDSIAIDDRQTLGGDLLDFLQSGEPLAACRNCLGTAGQRFSHAQVRRVEFRGLQNQPSEDLLDPVLMVPVPTR
jgi:organic radical activating enzyme